MQGLFIRRQSMNANFKNCIHANDVDITNPPLKPIDSLRAKMKIHKPVFIALISMILSGIGIVGFFAMRSRPMLPRPSLEHQLPETDSDRPASISIGTVLLLLAVGISGALGVRRQKKNKIKPVQKIEPQPTSNDRNKAFVSLNKQYLNLQYRITQNKFSGEHPPDRVLKEISELERKVRLISRALE